MNFRDFLNISKICDAHIHLADLYDLQAEFTNSQSYMCISCSHSQKEFMLNEKIKNASDSKIISAFGIHPQKPDLQNAAFLEELAKSSKIAAVGECGFDLFTPEFKSQLLEQTEAFLIQTELAVKYNLHFKVNLCAIELRHKIHGRSTALNNEFFVFERGIHSLVGTGQVKQVFPLAIFVCKVCKRFTHFVQTRIHHITHKTTINARKNASSKSATGRTTTPSRKYGAASAFREEASKGF